MKALVRLVANTIDSNVQRPVLALDAGREQVCVRDDGRESVENLQRVFSLRDERWDGLLPIWPWDDPPEEEVRKRQRERFPKELKFLQTWHAVRVEIRAALPKDGELVDRAKLATLGLR